MRGKPPLVRQYMTRIPIEVERCQNVAEAVRVMKSHNIRHIPVMSGSRLKGMLSQTDVLDARISHGDALDSMQLESICNTNVLSVSPITPVDEVARQMLARKVGSAAVVDQGFVVGIFTTTDALRFLSELGQ